MSYEALVTVIVVTKICERTFLCCAAPMLSGLEGALYTQECCVTRCYRGHPACQKLVVCLCGKQQSPRHHAQVVAPWTP